MRWSFPVARISDIEVRIHLTFLLLPAFFGFQAWQTGGPAGALNAVVFVLLIFLCVLLHEFGHAYAALGYGIRTPDITLLPIGGLARLERMPEKPSQEFVIAIAGPLVNVAIAGALALAMGGLPAFRPDRIFLPDQHLLLQLFKVNVSLVLFNLIPAFPMDGGRILRSGLASFLHYGTATRIAATIGQYAAFVLGFLGAVKESPMLFLVAVFVYLAADQEANLATLKDFASSLRLQDSMLTEFRSLRVGATLGEAVDLAVRTSQNEFPVIESDGRVRGLLTRGRLLRAVKEAGPQAAVADHMHADIELVPYFAPFSVAFDRLQTSPCPAVAIVDRSERLVGLLTADSLEDLMTLREAAKPR
ncbi:MAG: site-2 protease family protein [Verrucomicrobia bacterium]|nr:site-2 protease family protein [Verrucomicrobiota bacterium]